MNPGFEVRPGSVVGREFEIVRPLAHGGMGSVYVAVQRGTGVHRALKLMRPELLRDAQLKQRFEQEARVGAMIKSDHVVQVVAAGVDDAAGMPWIAMELLEGMDLGHYVRARGRLSRGEVADVVAQLCHALAAAHVVGVVHRDLKLENVFLAASRTLGRRSIVKVLDFGVAKVLSEARVATQALGTPLCMAPEQGYGKPPLAPATDVWALGLLVFHLLVGRCFWLSGNEDDAPAAAVLREVLFDPIPRASERADFYLAGDALPRGFDAWFARCVDREMAPRFRDAAEAWEALHPLVAEPGQAVAPQVLEPAALSAARAMATTAPESGPVAVAQAGVVHSGRASTTARLVYRERLGKTVVDVPKGTTVLEASLACGLPHRHECGGNARCTTCRVMVLDGEANLSARNEAEARVAAARRWPDNVRLACQARVLGDVALRRLVVDADDVGVVHAEASAGLLAERELVVMLCTVRNFRAFAAQNLPYDVAHVTQRLFRQLNEPLAANGGRARRFEGGTLLALFDAEERPLAARGLDAVRAGLRMRMRVRALNDYLARTYGHVFELGVALHAGPVLLGELGDRASAEGAMRVHLGEAMDLAPEVERVAAAAGATLAATEPLRALLAGEVRAGRELGRAAAQLAAEPVAVYELLDFARPDSVFLVQSTFEQVAPRADEFARTFYERLFARNPGTAAMFEHVDMQVQRSMLMNMLAVAVRGLDNLAPLLPAIRELGKRHVRYGATVPHYRAVGEALLWTLAGFFGDDFTPEVEVAWREVYGTLARTMIEAAREVPVGSTGSG